MISKQETFKNVLSNKYNSAKKLDLELLAAMKKLGWAIYFDHGEDGYKRVIDSEVGSIYYGFEGSPEWQNDVKRCLKQLDRL